MNYHEDGHMSIKTTKFVFYLIKAIQELSSDREWEKVAWDDPYSLMEKQVFCAKLNPSENMDSEKVHKPMQIPIKK